MAKIIKENMLIFFFIRITQIVIIIIFKLMYGKTFLRKILFQNK